MKYLSRLPHWMRALALTALGLVVLFIVLAGAFLVLPIDSPVLIVLVIVFALYLLIAPFVVIVTGARHSGRTLVKPYDEL